jgi:hypothetical protein
MSDLFSVTRPKPAVSWPGLSALAPAAAEPAGAVAVCAVCGALAGFGYGVSLRRGRPGKWACFDHRAIVEAMR